MRSILFKKADSQDYEKYVDIGYCERHYDFICTFTSVPFKLKDFQLII